MEYVGSDERAGSHEEGQLCSSTHQVFLCALGSPKPTFLGGIAYPTTHTLYSVCTILYANMPNFGQPAPYQMHLTPRCFPFSAAREFQKRLISRKGGIRKI